MSLAQDIKQTRGVAKRKNEYFWKPADKSRAVAAYIATGSFIKAATVTGIPENTLRQWAKQDWFAEEAKRVEKADSDEIKGTFTRIAKRAGTLLEDRLENGDEVVAKDGEIVMKKISGKELAIIAAVATDKRKILQDEPATVTVQNSQEKLFSLMEEFVKFAKAKEIKHGQTEIVVEPDQIEIEEFVGPSEGNAEDSSNPATSPSSPDSPGSGSPGNSNH